jgi:hypothetical protein
MKYEDEFKALMQATASLQEMAYTKFGSMAQNLLCATGSKIF